MADKDAAPIAVKKIAESNFRGKKRCRQNFAGGVVLHTQSGESRAASLEPVARRAIELHEFPELCGAQATLTRGSTALSGRADTGLAQRLLRGDRIMA